MHDMSASVQGIVCRSSLCFVLDLLIYGANSPCAIGQAASDTIKSFHDDALNITCFYLADFVPTPSGDGSRCIKPALFANSDTAVDSPSHGVHSSIKRLMKVMRTQGQSVVG